MSASFECIEVEPNLSLYKYQYGIVKIPSCSEILLPILKLLCEVFLFYIWFSTAGYYSTKNHTKIDLISTNTFNPIPYINHSVYVDLRLKITPKNHIKSAEIEEIPGFTEKRC